MITNATILRITAANAADAAGVITYTPAAGEITPVLRCSMTAPTRRQQIQLGAIIAEATAVIRVRAAELERAGVAMVEGVQVQAKLDRRSVVQTLIAVHVTDAVKSGMDNVTVFLRKG